MPGGAAAGREAGREGGKPAGAFERGARGERAPGEGCECGEGGIEPGEERDAVAGEACRRRQPGEFGDGLEVPGIIVVRPAEGSREFAAVADDQVTHEGRAKVVGDEAEGAGRMAGGWNCADAGQDLPRRVDRDGNRHRRGTSAEEGGGQAERMGAANAGAKDEPAIVQAAVAGAGDDRGAGRGSNCGSGAGVVAVTMCEEDAFERAADGFEGAEDGGRAIGEAGIDEGDAAGGDGDDEDVGAAGAGQPPDAGQGFFGEGGGHVLMVVDWRRSRSAGPKWVDGVPQCIAEEIDNDDGEGDSETGGHDDPGVRLEVLAAFSNHCAPFGRWRGDTQAEE